MSSEGLNTHVEHREAISIVSLVFPLDKKQASLWRQVEREAFEEDEYHIPLTSIQYGEETEFYLLYYHDKAVGRVCASIDRQWIEKKGNNLGFIEDLVINPAHRDLAHMLIKRCLDFLRDKGVEGAIVRSHSFPALAAQSLNQDVPPFTMPCNPPWYIDLFEQEGFVKFKEWANFRLLLPPKIPKDDASRSKNCVKHLDATMGPLNMKNRRQINEYNALMDDILEDHFGYTPGRVFTKLDSLPKHILFIVLCRLAKFQIYVIQTRSGQIVGLSSFAPNYNIALRPLVNKLERFRFLALAKFFVSLRRTKRAEIGAIGLSKEMRGKGFVKLMDHALKTMADAGYTEFDTGPILAENAVVIKMVGYIQKRYAIQAEHMQYYTLMYRF